MKAIVRDKYGPPDVLELGDIDEPELADVEVLLRVRATSVNPADWHILRGAPYIARVQLGLRKPKEQSPRLRCGRARRSGRQERHDAPARR